MDLKGLIRQYESQQKEIERVIFFLIFSKFKSENLQNLNFDSNKNLDDNYLDIFKNFQNMEQLRQQITSYLIEVNYQIEDNKKSDYLKYILFKVTYFTKPDLCRSYVEKQKPIEEEIYGQLINWIINSLKQIEDQYLNQNKNQDDSNQMDLEKDFSQQQFIDILELYTGSNDDGIFNKFMIRNQPPQIKDDDFEKENVFVNNFKNCIEILGNQIFIKEDKRKKTQMFRQFFDDLCRGESKTNIIVEYSIPYFKFFDKYYLYYIITKPLFIQTLKQDEVVFYFLIYSMMNLLKVNFLFLNIEQMLGLLVEKMQEFDNNTFEVGSTFILKLIRGLNETSILDKPLSKFKKHQQGDKQNSTSENLEDVHIGELFKRWIKTHYTVSDCWINKEQLQLYIDCAQSIIILEAIPELVRYYSIDEPIPYQPPDLSLGFSQQIVRGKRLYQKYPDESEQNKNYWFLLKENIYHFINGQQRKHKNIKVQKGQIQSDFVESDQSIFIKICQINHLMCQLFEKQVEEINGDSSLEVLIDDLIMLLDTKLLQNIYRQKQLFQLLSSLFIEENYVLLVLITRMKTIKSKNKINFHFSETGNLLLSVKQDFDIKSFITKIRRKKFSLYETDQQFCSLWKQFSKERENFTDQTIPLEQQRSNFQQILDYFGFLKRPKYEMLQQNIQMYLQHINLQMELRDKSKKKISFQKEMVVSKNQFIFEKVKIQGKEGSFILKYPDPNNNPEQFQKQQLREITILSMLQSLDKEDQIIRYIDHQVVEGGYFELFLENCEGESLQKYLDNPYHENTTVVKTQKLLICRNIIQCIDFLHENNIVHGEINFNNILITKNIKIKMISFDKSAFMVDNIEEIPIIFKESGFYKEQYDDYFSLGVLLMKFLYNSEFSDYFQEQKEINSNQMSQQQQNNIYPVKSQNRFHKNYFKNKTFKQQCDFPILLKQILSLFNDQPFLRCPLKELIYLFDIHIQSRCLSFKEIPQLIKDQLFQEYAYTLHSKLLSESQILNNYMQSIYLEELAKQTKTYKLLFGKISTCKKLRKTILQSNNNLCLSKNFKMYLQSNEQTNNSQSRQFIQKQNHSNEQNQLKYTQINEINNVSLVNQEISPNFDESDISSKNIQELLNLVHLQYKKLSDDEPLEKIRLEDYFLMKITDEQYLPKIVEILNILKLNIRNLEINFGCLLKLDQKVRNTTLIQLARDNLSIQKLIEIFKSLKISDLIFTQLYEMFKGKISTEFSKSNGIKWLIDALFKYEN